MKRRKFMPLSQWDVDHLAAGALLAQGNSDSVRLMMIRVVGANAEQFSWGARLSMCHQMNLRLDLWQETGGHRLNSQWLNLLGRLVQTPSKRRKRRQGLYLTDAEALTLFMLAFRYDLELESPAALLWEQYESRYPQVLRDPRWAYVSARILLEHHLIPFDEPLGSIREQYHNGHRELGGRWVRFFRLMRDTAEKEPVIPVEERADDDWIRVLLLDADCGEEYI